MYQTRVESLLCTQPCARPQGSSSDCGLSRNGSQWQGQTRIQDPVPYTHRASSRVGQGSPYSSYFPPPDLMGHETIWGHWSLPAMNMRNSRGAGDLIWYQKQNRKPQCSQCSSGPTTLYLPQRTVSHTLMQTHHHKLGTTTAYPSLQHKTATWLVLPEPSEIMHLMQLLLLGKRPRI